ncbi:MAG: hypothetical protein V4662_16425 [Verrucomicrobiota bacterium]
MASSPPIPCADRGRANQVALGILCALVAVESGLMVRAVLRHPGTPPATAPTIALSPQPLLMPQLTLTAPPVSISPPPIGQLAAPVAPPSAGMLTTPAPSGFGPPPVGSLQMTPSVPQIPAAPITAPVAPPAMAQNVPAASSPPRSAPPPLSQTAKGSDPASNMSLAEMVDLAKQVRSLGDMQGALEVLKRADLQFPATPEIIAETAQSYEQMGLSDKAVSHWKQLAAMDATRAGGYGDLAKRKLNIDGTSPGASTPAFAGNFGPKALSLGACSANRDASAVNGEKVVLRIPILRQGNDAIDPSQVDIDVYFFDRVNGEKIAQTIADEPLSAWGAPPVDWSGIGEEPLDVTYFLPALTPGEIAAHGRRAYHGYVVRLYYQHKLQDVAAEPRDLLDFGSPAPQTVPGGGANPLLPPVSN